MATQSYKERMAAASAAASAQRRAEKAEWHRRLELSCEVRRLALNAVKAGIRARGDKLSLYSRAQLTVMANELITPFLIEQVRARIAERSVRNVPELRTLAEGQPCEGKEIQR
jgi:hypothetical protein